MTQAVIALVGNPNCGKTTLFNALTGARQRVGNWPGVTVEKRSGQYHDQQRAIEVVDLPGTYCLDGLGNDIALDEQIARDYILSGAAHLIVNILDATNLERHLYLTSQLLDMGIPMIVVLNRVDIATAKGMAIAPGALAKQLGCPVVTTVASRKRGLDALKAQVALALQQAPESTAPLSLGAAIESCINRLLPAVIPVLTHTAPCRWYSLKLLEGETTPLGLSCPDALLTEARQHRQLLERQHEVAIDILIANGRYQTIGRIMTNVVNLKTASRRPRSERIDCIVLNRLLGLPIFFGVMYLMFLFAIHLGSTFNDFFGGITGTLLVDGSRYWLGNRGAPDWLIAILANGVGGGIQTVSTFIPIIGCLFLFLSWLEDSGYMARAAFIMDRAMRFIGLPGKAFVPMIVGFGCNVPAIMGTRTLENAKDRLLTIAMAPFISCSARLPVYALFAAAFFPATGQNIVFILYLVGIAAAVLTGLIVKRSLLAGNSAPFIMELPDYHLPSVKQVLLRTWDRLKAFIRRAGKAIVLIVVVLNTLHSLDTNGTFQHERSDTSLLSKISQMITPAFAPMGLADNNWPATVGIITGIFAKEAVVGTLDAMYQAMASANTEHATGGHVDKANNKEAFSLWAGLQAAWATIPVKMANLTDALTDPLGIQIGDLTDLEQAAATQGMATDTVTIMRSLFPSDAAVIAYLLFILLYTPCVAALGAVYRETNLFWTVFVAGWTFLLGYAVATLYYQLSLITTQPLTSLTWVAIIAITMTLVFTLMKRVGNGTALMTAAANSVHHPAYPMQAAAATTGGSKGAIC